MTPDPSRKAAPAIALTRKATGAIALTLAMLAGCATVPDGAPYRADASMGMLIARDSCSECHQTGLTGQSPNRLAPPFRDIANRPGLTQQALAAWLAGGHDYPAEMGFTLAPHQAQSLAAYMMRQRVGSNSPET